MLDLRKKKLQTSISVDGKDYSINTDFRIWLGFYQIIDSSLDSELSVSEFLITYFDEDVKLLEIENWQEAFNQLCLFYQNANSTPNASGSSSNERVIDFIEDGEYIYASFMQAYGIDLTEVDMHWHKFQALFRGLPDETKIKQIMGFRSYKEDKRKLETKYKENKQIWTLPNNYNKNKDKLMEAINNEFYGAV